MVSFGADGYFAPFLAELNGRSVTTHGEVSRNGNDVCKYPKRFRWPDLLAEVKAYVSTCDTCQ